AEELVDAAVVPPDDVARAVPDLVHDITYVLRVQAFVHRGEPREIREEDRHLTALLPRRGVRRLVERGGALAAKARLVGGARATTHAAAHQPPSSVATAHTPTGSPIPLSSS